MPRETLDQRFQEGHARRASDDFRPALAAAEKLFILWSLTQGRDIPDIAKSLGVSEAAARRFCDSFADDSSNILDLEVMEPVADGGATSYRCLVCAETHASPVDIERHILEHFLDGDDLAAAFADRMRTVHQIDPEAHSEPPPAETPEEREASDGAPNATDAEQPTEVLDEGADPEEPQASAAGAAAEQPDLPQEQPDAPTQDVGEQLDEPQEQPDATTQNVAEQPDLPQEQPDAPTQDVAEQPDTPAEPDREKGKDKRFASDGENVQEAPQGAGAGAAAGVAEITPILPSGADRMEILEALSSLTALRETSVPAADRPRGAAPDTPPESPLAMGADEVARAFDRAAEERGADAALRPEDAAEGERIAEADGDARQAEDAALEMATQSERLSVVVEASDSVSIPGRARGKNGVFGRLAGLLHMGRAEINRRETLEGIGSLKEATTVSIERGAMKILSTRLLDVVDYRIVPLSSLLYSGGLVADPNTISRYLSAALMDMDGAHRRLYAAVPGYQSALRRFDLPDVRGIDPKEIMPREARRALGFAADATTLRWQRLPGRARVGRWLVAAASEASYTAISSVIRGTGLKIQALELRPFPLARAVGHPTALCVNFAEDGCDVVVIRDWEPHTYQSAYWDSDDKMDGAELAARLTEVVVNTVDLHNLHNPEVAVSPYMPLAVTGGGVELHPDLPATLASNVNLNLVAVKNPLNVGSDFPYDQMVVNVGLSLWDV